MTGESPRIDTTTTGALPAVALPLPILAQPAFLAVKAALATALALALDALLGNPDHVSSTFVAVLCVSPSVLMGLRRAWAQMAGSTLGGLAGIAASSAGLPIAIGIPLAVGVAVGLAYTLRVPGGYPVAAFTALFVQLVPYGSVGDTTAVRLLAILVAGISGFVVNVVVSGHSYQRIFTRRADLAEASVLKSLGLAARRGPDAVQDVFTMVGEMRRDLDLVVEELDWRRSKKASAMRRLRQRVVRLRHLLHVASELGYQCRERRVERKLLRPFTEWLQHRHGTRPAVPAELMPAADRLVRALDRLGLHARPEPEAKRPAPYPPEPGA